MIQTRIAVLRKPVSGIYVIAAVIAVMIAANVYNVETASNLDEAFGESGANLAKVFVVPVVPLLV
jgi:hypothetical protein